MRLVATRLEAVGRRLGACCVVLCVAWGACDAGGEGSAREVAGADEAVGAGARAGAGGSGSNGGAGVEGDELGIAPERAPDDASEPRSEPPEGESGDGVSGDAVDVGEANGEKGDSKADATEVRLPPAGDDRALRAWGLIRSKRYEEARRILREVLAEYPDYSQAEFFLGVSYQKQKDYVRARRHFERVIASDVAFDRDETVYYFYGWSLYWLGELEEARAAFEEFKEAVPREADTYFALGLIDYDQDELESAEANFLRALDLHERMAKEDPRRYRGRLASVAKCHGRLADVHIRRGELEEARARLETAVELWPAHHQTYYKLYRVLTRLGDEEGAAAALRKQRQILRRRGLIDGGDG